MVYSSLQWLISSNQACIKTCIHKIFGNFLSQKSKSKMDLWCVATDIEEKRERHKKKRRIVFNSKLSVDQVFESLMELLHKKISICASKPHFFFFFHTLSLHSLGTLVFVCFSNMSFPHRRISSYYQVNTFFFFCRRLTVLQENGHKDRNICTLKYRTNCSNKFPTYLLQLLPFSQMSPFQMHSCASCISQDWPAHKASVSNWVDTLESTKAEKCWKKWIKRKKWTSRGSKGLEKNKCKNDKGGKKLGCLRFKAQT